MTDYRSPWTNHFYDVCAWFYWVPRDFNRIPDPQNQDKGWGPVEKKLKRSEVALNYILRMFFALAPDRVISELTNESAGEPWLDHYHVCGDDIEVRYGLPVNSTQPDFIFDGSDHLVTIEMKIGAKTDPKQLAKYLYFHAMAEQQQEHPRNHALIYLGPTSWPELWKDKRDLSFEDRLAEAIANAPKAVGMERVPVDLAKLEEMASRIQLGFLSYQRFVEILRSVRTGISGGTWELDVSRRLLDGVINEIVERGLAEVNSPK